jgi:tetratricopeptide (TPR) repeat protein
MRVSMEKYQCLGEALQAPSEGLLQSCEQALQAYTDTGTRMGQSSYLSSLAELYSALGDVEKGLGAVARGLAYVERSGERYAASLLLRVQADLVAASGRRDEAERLAEQAIEVARQQNAKTWELEASVALATCFVEEGNSGDVRRLLEPLCDWFEDEPPFPASIRARALLEARI